MSFACLCYRRGTRQTDGGGQGGCLQSFQFNLSLCGGTPEIEMFNRLDNEILLEHSSSSFPRQTHFLLQERSLPRLLLRRFL